MISLHTVSCVHLRINTRKYVILHVKCIVYSVKRDAKLERTKAGEEKSWRGSMLKRVKAKKDQSWRGSKRRALKTYGKSIMS